MKTIAIKLDAQHHADLVSAIKGAIVVSQNLAIRKPKRDRAPHHNRCARLQAILALIGEPHAAK